MHLKGENPRKCYCHVIKLQMGTLPVLTCISRSPRIFEPSLVIGGSYIIWVLSSVPFCFFRFGSVLFILKFCLNKAVL